MAEINEGRRVNKVSDSFLEKLQEVLDMFPGYRGYRRGVQNIAGMLQGEPNRYSAGEYARDLGYSMVPFYSAYDNYINDRPQNWVNNAIDAALVGIPGAVIGTKFINKHVPNPKVGAILRDYPEETSKQFNRDLANKWVELHPDLPINETMLDEVLNPEPLHSYQLDMLEAEFPEYREIPHADNLYVRDPDGLNLRNAVTPKDAAEEIGEMMSEEIAHMSPAEADEFIRDYGNLGYFSENGVRPPIKGIVKEIDEIPNQVLDYLIKNGDPEVMQHLPSLPHEVKEEIYRRQLKEIFRENGL